MLDKTIHIHAAPERVFEEITHVARAPRWHPGTLRAAPTTPGHAFRTGDAFHIVDETIGLRLTTEARVTALEPHRQFAWRQLEGDYAAYEGTYTLEPQPNGTTRVRLRLHLELPFILPWLVQEHEIERTLSTREDQALHNLKDVCERHA